MQKRVPALDLAKSLSIVFMVFVHVYEASACPSVISSSGKLSQFTGALIEFLGGIPSAGIFVLVMGFLVGWSTSKTPQKLIKEAGMLLLFGIAVNIFENWIPLLYYGHLDKTFPMFASRVLSTDIYFFDALAMLCLAFVLSFKKEKRIYIAGVMAFVSIVAANVIQLFIESTGSEWLDSFLGLFTRINTWSYFPLLNWLPLPLAGYICGSVFRNRKERGVPFTAKHYVISISAGLAMALAGFFYMKANGLRDSICFGSKYTVGDYYNLLWPNLLEGAGVIVLFMNAYSIICRLTKGRIPGFLTFMSGNIRDIYMTQWFLIGLLGYFFKRVSNVYVVLTIATGILAAAITVALLITKLRNNRKRSVKC